MPARSRVVVAAVVAVAMATGLLTSTCNGGDSAGNASTTAMVPAVTSMPSLADWCTIQDESLPTLSLPNLDGRELEVLDLHVARYTLLAAGAPGVPESAIDAMGRLAAAFAAIRDRVAAGERLAAVLAESFAGDESELIVAGTAADAEVTAICR